MYHRILNPKDVQGSIEPGMYVTPGTFNMHLQFLTKHFSIVSLNNIMTQSESTSGEKPLCAITFDDGWLDFKTKAFPLLQKYSVPATVFLPTDYIGTYKMFWTDILAEVMKESDRATEFQGNEDKTRSAVVKQVLAMQGTYETKLDNAIKLLKTLMPQQISDAIKELARVSGILETTNNRVFLNWDEVIDLKESGLVTFGSHSVHHHLLTSLQPLDVYAELLESQKTLLEKKAVTPQFLSFCYPNGNVTTSIAMQTRQAGYHLAVTTKPGWCNTSDFPFMLNRLGIHQDISSTKGLLAYRILSCCDGERGLFFG